MATMMDYDTLSAEEQVRVISEASEELGRRLYYSNDMDNLVLLAKNIGAVLERARNSIECLDLLMRGGDVYAKIDLLLDYMGKDGLSERFVNELAEVSEHAQEVYAKCRGDAPTQEEEQEVMRRLSSIMAKNEELALSGCENIEAE